MSHVVGLLVLVALLMGNAFFVAAEFALVSARVDQVEPRAEAGSARARTTLAAMGNVSQMMAGAQLGVTLCSLGLGAVGEPVVASLVEAPLVAVGAPAGLLHPVSLALALLLVTALHMVLGELVPKNVTIAGPDTAAIALGPPMAAIARLLTPLIWFFSTTANGFVRAFGVQPTDEVAASFDEGEIRSMITQSRRAGLLGSEVSDLAAGALTFEQHDARSVLLPADRLVTVPRDVSPRELEAAVAEHGFSRYPLCAPDGGWAGYVHVKDVLGVPADRRDEPLAGDLVEQFVEVHPSQPLPEVLQAMRDAGAHLARVVDGTVTVGVVALEDVLTRLIGDVRGATVTGSPAPGSRRGQGGG